MKDSERTNFIEWIEKAFNDGLSFKIIIDESHQNFTAKADEIVQLFKTDKIIRCSATPLADKNSKLIEVSEEDVIAEGLIKKLLVINEDFPQKIETENQTEYLLNKALAKQRELHALFLDKNADINPLIVVQLPNNSDLLLDTIEKFLRKTVSHTRRAHFPCGYLIGTKILKIFRIIIVSKLPSSSSKR